METNAIKFGTYDYLGAKETNGLADGSRYHESRRDAKTVDWTQPGLRITRLRLLSDPGLSWWDVSYCHGTLGGQPVDVVLPFDALPKRGLRAAIVAHAKRDGLYARGLGILDNISTLI